MKGGLAILDFGSQYTQLIARRLREMEYFCEIFPYNIDIEFLKEREPSGIILSGGPSSVLDKDSPKRDLEELSQMAPLLGICYGMQLMAEQWNGRVEKATRREYGRKEITWFEGLGFPRSHSVWMSHGDVVVEVPDDFEVLAVTDKHPAAMRGPRAMAFQFHPEVAHTEFGSEILKTYLDWAQAKKNWSLKNILDEIKSGIQIPGGERVLVALSGGVDSTVTAVLLTQVLGRDRVPCVFVDNGLLRKNEFVNVLQAYKSLDLNVRGVPASDLFMTRLEGVEDPETKRKIIGHAFVDVFKESIQGEDIGYLAQGTLYPDVIESLSPRGESVTIKSHHNVGGLPKDLNLKLVEPLRELFKDEVRRLGASLGIPDRFLKRHPFPGPGLAIRILGPVTRDSVSILQECDDIFIEELRTRGLYDQIWQAFCVLLPIRSVGVQGDARSYEKTLVLRAVTSRDGMTADWFGFDEKDLREISNRITNEVRSVNRVVYDVTSKPPGTIEWE